MTRDEKLATVEMVRARLNEAKLHGLDESIPAYVYISDVAFLLGFLGECAASHDELTAELRALKANPVQSLYNESLREDIAELHAENAQLRTLLNEARAKERAG